jgi:mutator protein MutT
MQIVTAAVMEKDGRILIAQRRRGDHQQYKWELPGGKLESHETLKECLQRELREELGIETEIGEFVGSSDCHYRHTSIRLIAFRAYHISGKLNALDHETIKWVLPSELVDFDFSEADKPIIQLLIGTKT